MAQLQATVEYAGNDFFIGISPGGHAQVFETNGTRAAAATPIEALLMAVGSCMASDVVDFLRKKGEPLASYKIEVRGERRTDFPRSYKRIELHHILSGPGLSDVSVKEALELSDNKYCSVAATFRPTTEVLVTHEVISTVEALA